MDIELFKTKLSALVEECGGMATDNFAITVHSREKWMTSADEMYERSAQPLKITFEVYAESLSEWQLNSMRRR